MKHFTLGKLELGQLAGLLVLVATAAACPRRLSPSGGFFPAMPGLKQRKNRVEWERHLEEGQKRRGNSRTQQISSVSRPICQPIHLSLSAKKISWAFCPPKLEFLEFWARRGWLSGPLLDPYLCSKYHILLFPGCLALPSREPDNNNLNFDCIGTPLS